MSNEVNDMYKKYQSFTDEELITKLRQGDSEIVNYIMEKYKNLVRHKAKTMFLIGGDNDDLIQEGMIGLFKAIQDYKFDANSTFRSFAGLCIDRQLYTAIKTSQRKKHGPLNSYVSIDTMASEENETILIATSDVNGNPEDLLIGKEYEITFWESLEQELSELEKKVLYLYMREIDYLTIAKLMDKSEKTVDNAIQRIKTKAKKQLEEIPKQEV